MKPTTIDKYLELAPTPQRETLERMRQTINHLVPKGTVEGFSYGVPAFLLDGKAILGFASAKNHCSLFPMSGKTVAKLAQELEKYDASKGTIRFPIDKPLPATLIKKIIKTRLAEMTG